MKLKAEIKKRLFSADHISAVAKILKKSPLSLIYIFIELNKFDHISHISAS